MDCLPFSDTTGELSEQERETGSLHKGSRTSVDVSLLGKLVIRITVGVNGPVELLERHEGGDELIVGSQKAAEPLLRFNMVDLRQFVS